MDSTCFYTLPYYVKNQTKDQSAKFLDIEILEAELYCFDNVYFCLWNIFNELTYYTKDIYFFTERHCTSRGAAKNGFFSGPATKAFQKFF